MLGADKRMADLTAITGAEVNPAADTLWLDDTSAGAAGSKKITIDELVNVSSFTNGNFLAANSVEFSQVNGLVDHVDDSFNSAPLLNYRSAITAIKRPSVLIFGDSMFGTSSTLTNSIITKFTTGNSGAGLMPAGRTGGAVAELDSCLKWISGETTKLSGAGHTVTYGGAATFAVASDTLKIYYLQQPGGGIFKIQSDMNDANVFADEAGYTSIDTNGAIAGMVVTITKSNYRQKWRTRCVWVSANGQVTGVLGAVNIIGSGVRDSRSTEGLVTVITNGSTASPDNNVSAASATPRAITDPIMADLAPNLVFMSHLDGAGTVNMHQGTFQDNINAGIVSTGGLPASWIVISCPPGPNSSIDTANKAQMEAQRALARTRGDAFLDNYSWMGGYVNALAQGYLSPGDVHPTVKAQNGTASMIASKMSLLTSANRNERITPFLEIAGGGKFHGYVSLAQEANSVTTFHEGNLRLVAPPGSTSGGPALTFEPFNAIPGNANSGWVIKGNQTNGAIEFASISQAMWNMQQNIGVGAPFYQPTSTPAVPDGVLGLTANPIRAINLGKSIKLSSANFTAATTDICTMVAHGLESGDPVRLTTSGTLPAGLFLATSYYVIYVSDDTFRLTTTYALAIAATTPLWTGSIDITSIGSGTHKFNSDSPSGSVVNKVTGRVWFDVGASTLTVTNARCTTNSVIIATVLGSDPTATSVRVTTISAGSFVLTLNAAATAKTAVNFWVMP